MNIMLMWRDTFERKDNVQFVLDSAVQYEWLQNYIRESACGRIFVCIDANVKRLWGKSLECIFRDVRKDVFLLPVVASEGSKSLVNYPCIIEFLEANLCNRFDLLLGIGGGIIVDLVSFVASTYMRGLPLVLVPTTLIGQMDASTAGKTCLNTGLGKNILGTFYYPELVYNNVNFLHTNDKVYLRQGYSEIFKYGLLASRGLIRALETYTINPCDDKMLNILEESIQIRAAIRKKDPLVSNLGHTFGHALEKLSGYRILHGDAISVGTIMAINFALERGLMSGSCVCEITEKMMSLGLNVYVEKGVSASDLVCAMLRDKKASVKMLNLVLIEDIAKPYESGSNLFYSVSPEEMKDFLEDFLADYRYKIDKYETYLNRADIYYCEGV